jgi:hypothetical protein
MWFAFIVSQLVFLGADEGTTYRAVRHLAPLPHATAKRYARWIHRGATRSRIDPLVVVALIHRESRWKWWLVSKKNHGLLQVRVSSTTNPRLRGREHVLLRPRRNIREGLRLLRMWKRYHERVCGEDSSHFWTSHYQWGHRVGDRGSGERVFRLYSRLVLRRFRR